jgi:hypothetical protein
MRRREPLAYPSRPLPKNPTPRLRAFPFLRAAKTSFPDDFAPFSPQISFANTKNTLLCTLMLTRAKSPNPRSPNPLPQSHNIFVRTDMLRHPKSANYQKFLTPFPTPTYIPPNHFARAQTRRAPQRLTRVFITPFSRPTCQAVPTGLTKSRHLPFPRRPPCHRLNSQTPKLSNSLIL